MKWANLLFYGLVLGLLLTAMQFFQYRLVLLRHSMEWYVGLVALLFTILGIWAGMKLTRKPTPAATVVDLPAPLRPKEEILEQSGITPRELEVLDLMARGLSNQEIADRLYVSLNTVKTHASNVFSKLDVQRRTQAIQKAKVLGLIET